LGRLPQHAPKGSGGGSPRRFVGVAPSPRRLAASSHPLWMAPGGIYDTTLGLGGEEIRTPTPPTLPPTLQPTPAIGPTTFSGSTTAQTTARGRTRTYLSQSNPTRSSRGNPMPSDPGSSILPATAATDTVPLTTCHSPRTERRNRAGVVTLHERQPCVKKLGVDVLFVVVVVTSATLSIWESEPPL
jgi:hypothetical protein